MDDTSYKKTLEELYNFSQLLSQHNIKHWLDWGVLLHGYRDKKIRLDSENDFDLGILKQDWVKVNRLLKDNSIKNGSIFKPTGDNKPLIFPGEINLCNEKRFCRFRGPLSVTQVLNYGRRIDLYFWDSDPEVSNLPDTYGHRRYEMLRQEIISTPRSALFCQGLDTHKPNKYLRQTKKYFIQELDELDINGFSFPVPRYIEKFLEHRYGPHWWNSMTKQEHDEYIENGFEEEHFIKEDDITVLVEGVWDLFHQGHVELLKRVHDIYDRVVVGIASDDLVRSYKRDPIIPYDDRVKMLEACKYVDEIYHNAPCLNITEKALDECDADYVLHSVNDPNNWKTELRELARYDQSLIDSGRAHFLSYTGYHSTDIIDKILKDNK